MKKLISVRVVLMLLVAFAIGCGDSATETITKPPTDDPDRNAMAKIVQDFRQVSSNPKAKPADYVDLFVPDEGPDADAIKKFTGVMVDVLREAVPTIEGDSATLQVEFLDDEDKEHPVDWKFKKVGSDWKLTEAVLPW